MNLKEAQKILNEDLAKRTKMVEELKELKEKMDKAEEALSLKLAEGVRSGKIQSGGYIVTGEEDESFMETLRDMQEYEEDLCAGPEKAAYADARMAFWDKMLELDKMDDEIALAEAAVERAKGQSEPGGEDE